MSNRLGPGNRHVDQSRSNVFLSEIRHCPDRLRAVRLAENRATVATPVVDRQAGEDVDGAGQKGAGFTIDELERPWQHPWVGQILCRVWTSASGRGRLLLTLERIIRCEEDHFIRERRHDAGQLFSAITKGKRILKAWVVDLVRVTGAVPGIWPSESHRGCILAVAALVSRGR